MRTDLPQTLGRPSTKSIEISYQATPVVELEKAEVVLKVAYFAICGIDTLNNSVQILILHASYPSNKNPDEDVVLFFAHLHEPYCG